MADAASMNRITAVDPVECNAFTDGRAGTGGASNSNFRFLLEIGGAGVEVAKSSVSQTTVSTRPPPMEVKRLRSCASVASTGRFTAKRERASSALGTRGLWRRRWSVC